MRTPQRNGTISLECSQVKREMDKKHVNEVAALAYFAAMSRKLDYTFQRKGTGTKAYRFIGSSFTSSGFT